MAVKWLRIFDDFGILARDCIETALQAFAELRQISEFGLRGEGPGWGSQLEILVISAGAKCESRMCRVLLSLAPDGIGRLIGEEADLKECPELCAAHMRKLVSKLNFAQAAVMGREGRVALRPRYDSAPRGEKRRPPRSKWTLKWRLRNLPLVSQGLWRQ